MMSKTAIRPVNRKIVDILMEWNYYIFDDDNEISHENYDIS